MGTAALYVDHEGLAGLTTKLREQSVVAGEYGPAAKVKCGPPDLDDAVQDVQGGVRNDFDQVDLGCARLALTGRSALEVYTRLDETLAGAAGGR
jgi:hypothetical protein